MVTLTLPIAHNVKVEHIISANHFLALINGLRCHPLRDYMLQTSTQRPAQLLFKFADGRYLTRSSITCNLQALLHVRGVNSTHYASHSFRSGAATTAGATGRWKSDAYQSYILMPKETILQVLQNLACCPGV